MGKRSRQRKDLHLKLVQEISHLVNQRRSLETILDGVVRTIAAWLEFDVVSVYLLDAAAGRLVIRSTVGLKMDPANPIHLQVGEGLTGWVYQSRRSLAVTPASEHPRYKYFPDSQEEKYDSYLGVPILLHGDCLGVLVAQTRRTRPINPAEETLFQIVSSRLAGLLEVADRLERLKGQADPNAQGRAFQGKGISGGFAVGTVFVFRGLFREGLVEAAPGGSSDQERIKLETALAQTGDDLARLVADLETQGRLAPSEISIFRSHGMILADPAFRGPIRDRLLAGRSARQAVIEAVEEMAQQFDQQADAYIRERAQDLRDLGEKILQHLGGQAGPAVGLDLPPQAVLVARDIGPTVLAAINRTQIAAIVTEKGGETSHTAILARSLGIPSVAGIEGLSRMVAPGQTLLVDGQTGFVFLNPGRGLIREYQTAHDRRGEIREIIEADTLAANDDAPGVAVTVTANIGYPAEVPLARSHQVAEVGLFRTEFAFMQHDDWPGVERQQAIYEDVARSFDGSVTVRSLDIGGDKLLPYFRFPREDNPLLGMRSIRFSMEYLDLFRDQVRAVLLARASGCNLRLVLPMVSNIWEVEASREILHQQAREIGLHERNLPPLGIMVEVPAVVYQLDDYKALADFICVGSNDLVQYLLAVDRSSSTVAHLYSSFHPAVLRVLHDIAIASRALGKEVTVCGEMAGTPGGALALLAAGYTRLSVLPSRAPLLRYLARRVDESKLQQLRWMLMGEKKEAEIRRFLNETVAALDPVLARAADGV